MWHSLIKGKNSELKTKEADLKTRLDEAFRMPTQHTVRKWRQIENLEIFVGIIRATSLLMPGFHQIETGSRNRPIQVCFSLLHKGLQEFMVKISKAVNLNLFW